MKRNFIFIILLLALFTGQAEAQRRRDALDPEYRPRCLTLLAELYNHMAEGFRSRAEEAAKEAIDLRPREKDNLDALTWAMGGALADWNFANHSRLIAYWQAYVEKYPDHSPAFWAAVAAVLPDYKQRQRLLKMG